MLGPNGTATLHGPDDNRGVSGDGYRVGLVELTGAGSQTAPYPAEVLVRADTWQ